MRRYVLRAGVGALILCLAAIGVSRWISGSRSSGSSGLDGSGAAAGQGSQLATDLTNTTATNRAPKIPRNLLGGVRSNQEELDREFNPPISFDGSVVDQDGDPIIDVRVKLVIKHTVVSWTDPRGLKSPLKRWELTTDALGQFSIRGEKGSILEIASIEKPGYELSKWGRFTFNYLLGSSGKPKLPVVYKMWKRGISAKLKMPATARFGVSMVGDGRAYTVDLLEEKKLAGKSTEGDVYLGIECPTNARFAGRFVWSFWIEGIHGGLVEAPESDEFMYLAPETGYQTRYELTLDPSDPAWSTEVQKRFFFRLRDGQVYGRLEIKFFSVFDEQSWVKLDWRLNPTGSRNLQP